MSREGLALAEPPAHIHRGTLPVATDFVLFRVHGASYGPWHFCSDMACRFDLPSPRGTCYWGTDAITAFLESMGGQFFETAIPQAWLDMKRVSMLDLRGAAIADLANRQVVSLGVTREIAAYTPYDLPQRWAERLAEHHDGLVWQSRFDVDPKAAAVCLFGVAGQDGPTVLSTDRIGVDLKQRLQEECGLQIAGPPSLRNLTIV